MAQLYVLGYRRFKIVDQALTPSRPVRLRDGSHARLEMGASGPFGEEAPGAWLDADATLRRLRAILKRERRWAPRGRFGRWTWIYNGLTRLPRQRHSLRQWRSALTTYSWYDLHATGAAEGTAPAA